MSIEKYVFPEFRLSSLKLLRCLKLSTVEVLYSGLITIFCIYWFPLQFWYGHWFLTKLLPASKGDWWFSWAEKPKSKLVRSRCNFSLVVWNLFTLGVNLACGTCNWRGLVLKQIVLNEGAEIINLVQLLSYFRAVMCRAHNEPRCLFGPCNDVSVCVSVCECMYYAHLYLYNMICSYGVCIKCFQLWKSLTTV